MSRFIQSDGNGKGHPRTQLGTYGDKASGGVGSPVLNAAQAMQRGLRPYIVFTAPVITQQPVAFDARPGIAPPTVSVVATANGDITYQWYKDSSAISGATSATYQPANLITLGEQHGYKCLLFNNGKGTWSNEVYGVCTSSAWTELSTGSFIFDVGGGLAIADDGQTLFGFNSMTGHGLFKSLNAGNTWAQVTTYPVSGGMYPGSVAISDDGLTIHAAFGATVYSSRDGGTTWGAGKIVGSTTRLSVACSTDGKNVVTCSSDTNYMTSIYTSTDYGATFTSRSSSARWSGCTISSNGTHAYAYNTTDGYIYTSADLITFTQFHSVGGYATVLAAYNGGVFAAYNDNTFWRYRVFSDAHVGLQTVSVGGSPVTMYGAHASTDGTKFSVEYSNGGALRVSIDSGVSYQLDGPYGYYGQAVNRAFTKRIALKGGYTISRGY